MTMRPLICALLMLLPCVAFGQQEMTGKRRPGSADRTSHASVPPAAGMVNQQPAPFVQPPDDPTNRAVSHETTSAVTTGPDEIVVLPEVSQVVEFSNSAFNRIRCFDTIQDVVASEDKLLDVRWAGDSAFVKFKYLRNNEGKATFTTKTIELNIPCGGEMYTIIAVPKSLPASPKIRLSSGKKKQIQQNAALFSGLALETKARRFVQYAYKDNVPASFELVNQTANFKLFREMDITLTRIVTATGEGLRLKEFKVTNSAKESVLRLSETMFLKTELASKPVFIVLSKLNLKPGEDGRVFIVEQTGGNREQGQR